jgi:hypothetical protein
MSDLARPPHHSTVPGRRALLGLAPSLGIEAGLWAASSWGY